MTDDRTGPARLGIVSAGGNTGEDDFSRTVNVGCPGSTAGQSSVTRRGGTVTDITGITGIKVLDVTGGVFANHISAVVAMAGIASRDAPFGAAPDRSSRGVNTGRIVDTTTAVRMTTDTGTTAITSRGVCRIQTTASRFNNSLERTGRSENVLEGPLVMGIDEVVVVTEDAGEIVTAGDTGVRGMGRRRFVLIDSGG